MVTLARREAGVEVQTDKEDPPSSTSLPSARALAQPQIFRGFLAAAPAFLASKSRQAGAPAGKVLAKPWRSTRDVGRAVPTQTNRSMPMKHQRHYGASLAALKEAEQIRKLIADLDRLLQIITCDIATEEERARVSDRSDAAYPILARVLAARRDNLRDTITALEQRLSSLPTETVFVPELA
jgi:hypothetical protein